MVLPFGTIALGLGMLVTPSVHKGFGRLSVGLGLAGLAAAILLLIDPLSPIAVVGVLALILFHAALGWKLYALSKVSTGAQTARET